MIPQSEESSPVRSELSSQVDHYSRLNQMVKDFMKYVKAQLSNSSELEQQIDRIDQALTEMVDSAGQSQSRVVVQGNLQGNQYANSFNKQNIEDLVADVQLKIRQLATGLNGQYHKVVVSINCQAKRQQIVFQVGRESKSCIFDIKTDDIVNCTQKQFNDLITSMIEKRMNRVKFVSSQKVQIPPLRISPRYHDSEYEGRKIDQGEQGIGSLNCRQYTFQDEHLHTQCHGKHFRNFDLLSQQDDDQQEVRNRTHNCRKHLNTGILRAAEQLRKVVFTDSPPDNPQDKDRFSASLESTMLRAISLINKNSQLEQENIRIQRQLVRLKATFPQLIRLFKSSIISALKKEAGLLTVINLLRACAYRSTEFKDLAKLVESLGLNFNLQKSRTKSEFNKFQAECKIQWPAEEVVALLSRSLKVVQAGEQSASCLCGQIVGMEIALRCK